MQISGRTVVVTGGGGGIGRATAELLARAGAQVVVIDLSGEAAARTERSLEGEGHRAIALDVTDHQSLAELFADLARDGVDLAGVVNAAGIVTGGDPWPASALAKMAAVISVNCIGTVTTTTLAAAYPIPGPRAVVNVASAAAIRPLPPDPAYALSKAGVLAFTRSAALGNAEIRVNAVLPGVVRTAMLATTGRDGVADWLAHRLDGPLLEPEQIADAILDLLTSEANGQAWSLETDPQAPERMKTTVV